MGHDVYNFPFPQGATPTAPPLTPSSAQFLSPGLKTPPHRPPPPVVPPAPDAHIPPSIADPPPHRPVPATGPPPSTTVPIAPDPDPQPHPADPLKPHAKPIVVTSKKLLAVIPAMLLSLVSISLAYAVFLHPYELSENPTAPLVIGVLLTIIVLAATVHLCAAPKTAINLGGLLPVVFSLVAGGLLILAFAFLQKNKNDGVRLNINFTAVLISMATFGGVSIGAAVGYFIFAKDQDDRE